MMTRLRITVSIHKQRGAALLILAVILILTVALIMVGKKSRNADQIKRETDVTKILVDAKEALISVAIAHPTNPGALPYPDRGNLGFNGTGDCNGQTTVNLPLRTTNPSLLIGRFPYLNQSATGFGGCTLINIAHNTSESPYPLHYAVSENLVEYSVSTAKNYINSNVLKEPDVPLAPSGWLTVYDSNGNTLSSRVAFIIFYPGAPLSGQNRAPVNANTAQFLDSYNVPGIGAVNNADPTSGSYVSAPETSTFNDKLVYVTADEIMRRVELRMLKLIATNLSSPYPATLPTSPAPFNVQPLSNWIGAGVNTYDQTIDSPGGGTGYSATSISISNTQKCAGTPGASLRGVNVAPQQCIDLP